MDYSAALDNPADQDRISRTFGLGDPSSFPGLEKKDSAHSRLTSMFHSEVPCEACARSFVDEASLAKHVEAVHTAQNVEAIR